MKATWGREGLRRRQYIAFTFTVLVAFLSPVARGQAVTEAPKTGAALDKAVEAAIDAQEQGIDVSKAVVGQVITQEEPAKLANGDGDVSLTGSCRSELDTYCIEVKAGEGRLAKCLGSQVKEQAKDTYTGPKISDACLKELDAFKIDRSTNINKDLPLAKACKADAEKLCTNSAEEEGGVLSCLRWNKDSLTEACKAEVFAKQEEGALDFRMDKELYASCKADAEANCKGIEPVEGQVQECLKGKRSRLSWDCQEQLFRQETENADDLRLSVKLFKVCFADKKKFCADVQPGNARAKECLEEHRTESGFGEACKKELEAMMEARAADFRLDSQLRELCEDDIEELCSYEKDSLDTVPGVDARVIDCLQDYKDEVRSPACLARIEKSIQLASSDIRFDVPLADACFDDRSKFCGNVLPGSARVIRCLQDRRDELSYECKATLFDQEQRMAESIDYQFPMAQQCTAEVAKFCKDVPHGNERVIRCLQDNLEQPGFGAACKTEVQNHDERSGQDYRLKYRLNRACKDVIAEKCASECDNNSEDEPCEGRVLLCLTKIMEEITNEECKKEVFYYEKMEVRDFKNDVFLADACRTDVESFCANVERGEGRVLACLRDNREKLSEACRAEETRLAIMASSNTELMPRLSVACADERETYCKGVRPGKARVFNCLINSSVKKDFSKQCQEQLTKQIESRVKDWRLDYNLFQACRGDVPRVCSSSVKEDDKSNGATFQCLVKATATGSELLSDYCSTSVARSIKTALEYYQKGLPVTDVCDEDVKRGCSADPLPVGHARECLLKLSTTDANADQEEGKAGARRKLADQYQITSACKELVLLSSPDDVYKAYQSTLQASAISTQMKAIESTFGLKEGTLYKATADKKAGITLSGWSAIAGMFALVVVLVSGGVFGYRRYHGYDKKGYTMVVKNKSSSNV